MSRYNRQGVIEIPIEAAVLVEPTEAQPTLEYRHNRRSSHVAHVEPIED